MVPEDDVRPETHTGRPWGWLGRSGTWENEFRGMGDQRPGTPSILFVEGGI